MTWVSVCNFTESTGISGDVVKIQKSLNFAEDKIIKDVFVSREDKTTALSTDHVLECDFVMDIDGDAAVTTSDIDLFEVDTEGRITDLNDKKQEFIINENRLLTTELVPTINRELHIVYKTGREQFSDMLSLLGETEEIIAVNHIFSKNRFGKLQSGISNWTLNGVTISYDSASIKGIIDDNKDEIRSLYKNIRPKRLDGVRIGEMRKYNGLRRGRGLRLL